MSGYRLARKGQVLEFSMQHVWGEAEREAWERDFAVHLDALAPGFAFLVDLSEYPPQDARTQAVHNRCMSLAVKRGLGVAVHVVPSPVVRNQMKRTSDATPDGARFVYVPDLAQAQRVIADARAGGTSSGADRLADPAGLPPVAGAPAGRSSPVVSEPRPADPVPGARPVWIAVLAGAVSAALAVGHGDLAAGAVSVSAALAASVGALRWRRGRPAQGSPRPAAFEPLRTSASAALLGEVGSAAESVAAQARRLREGSTAISGVVHEVTDVARRVETQAADIGERLRAVATETGLMASSITQMSDQTARANGLASGASAQARLTRESVRALDESSREIGNVVLLIRQIAEQTNMLSLNATIEAARAGPAGRGFAVVAAEVKALAQATAAATRQIGDQVGTIQREVLQTVEAIDGISGVVADVRTAQDAVVEALGRQRMATAGIEGAVAATTGGAGDLLEQLRRLVLATPEVAASAGDVRTAAGALDAVAQNLTRLALPPAG